MGYLVHMCCASGLLNFGNPDSGTGPEGNLLAPIPNMEKYGLPYEKLDAQQIMDSYPFKNLPESYVGIYSPDCGCINVPLMWRSLHTLCCSKGVESLEYANVMKVKADSKSEDVHVTYQLGTGAQLDSRMQKFRTLVYILDFVI